MNKKSNTIYFDNNWGMFVGSFNDNRFHKHYAVQLSVSIKKPVEILSEKNSVLSNGCVLIKSNVLHQLNCTTNHLVFLFNPTSQTGHYLQQKATQSITEFKHPIINQLRSLASRFLKGMLSFQSFIKHTKLVLGEFNCECEGNIHISDNRVYAALNYLKEKKDRVVPLNEIASFSCLSPSRFLHLFKEKTNITYRRAQLWNKISHSLPYLSTHGITETAHQFGFTDSAHYAKVFKENFGFTPKMVSKS